MLDGLRIVAVDPEKGHGVLRAVGWFLLGSKQLYCCISS